MRWVRAWPEHPKPDRNHVVDKMQRVTVDGYDYSGLAAIMDDVCLLDWDIAMSPEDRTVFACRAAADPDWPRVAPYRLYHRKSEWAAYRPGWEPVDYGEPTCSYFGFGIVYLPRILVVECLWTRRNRTEALTDCEFSTWFWERYRRPTPIDWDLHPVHLHE